MTHYTIGDLFEWTSYADEVSTLIEVWYDWDGETKYTLESYSKNGREVCTRDFFSEEELIKLVEDKIAIHYPVKK